MANVEWGKINSYNFLSVMDHMQVYLCLSVSQKNNHELFTSSPLYLEEGDFFSLEEFMAADGAFEGDGRFLCSYKNPGNDPDKKI